MAISSSEALFKGTFLNTGASLVVWGLNGFPKATMPDFVPGMMFLAALYVGLAVWEVIKSKLDAKTLAAIKEAEADANALAGNGSTPAAAPAAPVQGATP